MAPYSFPGLIKAPDWFEKTLIKPSTHGQARAPSLTHLAQQLQWEGGNNSFLNLFGISELPETWIRPDELYGAILCSFQLLLTF